MNKLWQKYKFGEAEIYSSAIGQYQFWIKKQGKLWYVARMKMAEASQSVESKLDKVTSLAEGSDWEFNIADKHCHAYIMPATPDRPLIIKSSKKISVLPRMSLDLFIEIPVWIQLYASSVKPENLLLEFPSSELSSTWFGDPDNGELAYSYSKEIIYDPEEIRPVSGNAVCPIRIKNESDITLNFQRLSVPIFLLNLYGNSEMLCTNEVNVRYKGDDNTSEIHIAGNNPSVSEGLKLIVNARIKSNRSFLKKSFSFIKSIADY
ncbi:MAG: DUF432 domain-containing protein [Bacteroidales bacterium]|nr:DUF432 domain-containing protein [Bacteroidales bacterium]